MKTESAKPNSERNYGIDLLRILCMFLIVALHITRQGGVMNAVSNDPPKYYLSYILYIACFPAVDCFALISGYVGLGGRHRYSALALMWLQVWVISSVTGVLFAIFRPDVMGADAMIRCLLPLFEAVYWYFSAYFGLYLFMPLLDAAIDHMEPRRLAIAVVSMLSVFSVLVTFFYIVMPDRIHYDTFDLGNGYTVLWLIIMYIVGAAMRRMNPFARVSTGKLVLMYLASVAFCCASVPMLKWMSRALMGNVSHASNLVKYMSPPIVLSAILMLELFRRVRVGARTAGVIRFLSPLTFSVYLIHAHPLTLSYLLMGRFRGLSALPAPLIIPGILLAALGLFVVCCAIDFLRHRLFVALKLRQRLEKLIDARLDPQ